MKPRDIAQQLSGQRAQKQNREPWYRAEIVEMRNSAGEDTVEVENRPYFVWVRLWSAQGNVVPAYNVRVAATAGLAVLVSRMPGSESGLEIIGLDIEIFEAQDNPPNPGLTQRQHATAHEWPDGGPGLDVITVYPRSWSQLRVYPQDPLSLLVNVSPITYAYGNDMVRFDGGVVDLTAVEATLAVGEARLTLVYLDLTTNTLGSTNGAIGVDAGGWFLDDPAVSNNSFPSAVVRIHEGQTEISEDEIRDRRMFLNGAPGSSGGWPFDTAILTVDTTDVDADYATVAAAIAAIAADELILVSPETHVCDNQTLPADNGLGSWDRELAFLDTATQLIALTTSSDTHVFQISFSNSTNNAADTEALRIGASGCELWGVGANASNGAAGGDGIGFYVVNTVTGVRLTDCYGRGSSVGGLGYGLYIPDAGSADIVIRDGTLNGNDVDLFVGSGSTVHLYGVRLVNGTIGGTGTVTGWYYDESNDVMVFMTTEVISGTNTNPIAALAGRGVTVVRDSFAENNIYSYYNAGGITSGQRYYMSRGTLGAEAATQLDDGAFVGFIGHDGTVYVASSRAMITMQAAENWTAANRGTYMDFYATAVGGNVRSQIARITSAGVHGFAGKDSFPNDEQFGLYRRLINQIGLTTWVSHFRTGDIAGAGELAAYTWQGAPFGGVPPVLTYSTNGEYLTFTDNAGPWTNFFMSAPITNAAASWQGKSIYARVRVGLAIEAGIRIDAGNDNNYVELFMDGQAGDATQTFTMRWVDNGGAAVTTASNVIIPTNQFITMWLRCYWTGANYVAYGYLITEDNSFVNVTGFVHQLDGNWAVGPPTAGRVGLFSKQVAAANLCSFDWFYHNFT